MADLTLKGHAQVAAELGRVSREILQAAAEGLFQAGEEIMGESKAQYVPVDLGVLRASGHVELPKIEGDSVSVTLGYGGPAAPYALVQHENLTYKHTVGSAKYLELPLLARAKSLTEQVVAHVHAKLGG